MAIAYYGVLFLHVVACLFLIGVVLLQQGKSQDLASAFGGGGTQAAFGPRAGANVLTRATTILAAVFMVTSLALTVLRPSDGVLDRIPTPAASPAAVAPGTGASPAAAVPAPAAVPDATAPVPPPAPAASPVAQ